MTSTTLVGSAATARTVAPLSAREVSVLREMLEEQRDFRVEQLAQLHRPGARGPLSSTDPEIFRSLASGARAALRDVQAALWRMEEGRYGVCVACGRPVEMIRLEILPQVARCMPCQRAHASRPSAG
ncbi:MAG TPA: TraR/DksA C4-type zinc finger protein [Jatrophihabitans sp.]|nr:TraR/DksA C4-type zinc finger protein [Jatrophihabitans sp.]